MGTLVADLEGFTEEKFPSVNLFDTRVVETRLDRHPPPQCRLDTFKAGTLCHARWSEAMDHMEFRAGTCHEEHFPAYSRPRCWFSPHRVD
jgi:hypothetical protein